MSNMSTFHFYICNIIQEKLKLMNDTLGVLFLGGGGGMNCRKWIESLILILFSFIASK